MEIKNLKPLNGNILILDCIAEEKTSSGIYIPEKVQEDIKTGYVLSTSTRVTEKGMTIEPEVKSGDQVLYRSVAGAGNCFKEKGNMYRILSPVEILAVVE